MGKAGRWLRSFLTGRKDKKGKDRDKADCQSLPTPASTPSAKEKRRWSFRRAAVASGKDTRMSSRQGQLASTSSHCFSEVHVVVQEQHAVDAPPEVAIAADTVVLPASKGRAGDADAEEAAAIKIQLAFRSYLVGTCVAPVLGLCCSLKWNPWPCAGEEGAVRAERDGEAAGDGQGPAGEAAGERDAPPHAGAPRGPEARARREAKAPRGRQAAHPHAAAAAEPPVTAAPPLPEATGGGGQGLGGEREDRGGGQRRR